MFHGTLLFAVFLQHAAQEVELFGQGLGLCCGFAEQHVEGVALFLQLRIGLAGLGLQAGQLFAALVQAVADLQQLLQLAELTQVEMQNADLHQLYLAAMDGTGNSMFDDKPEGWSVVAKIHQQVRELQDEGVSNIATGYVEGTYTQNGLLNKPEKLWDGRFGHTFDERVETAYLQFCEQAKQWLDEDPEAQIRIAGVGFSRGGESIAALQRMVHERGIRDPLGAKVERDAENLVVSIQYADRPLLVEPGKTPQVALYNTIGELKYGLAYPDGIQQRVDPEHVQQWMREARRSGSVGVVMRVKGQDELDEIDKLPKDGIRYEQGNLVIMILPKEAS